MVEVRDKQKLGELIVELGILDNRDLGQALSIAQETSLPLGRVLVLSEMVTEEVLMAILRCQSLLKQNLVEIDLARKAMQQVSQNKSSLDDALFKLGWNPTATKDTTPLGELLIEAGYVSREQLQQSLEKNTTTGLPFGRLLVLSGALTEGLLTGALNAQILIRDGKLSKSQAAEALKEAKLRQVSVETQLKEKGFYDMPGRSCPRLGELLLFCGVISQSDLVSALELGLMNKTPVGQVLTDSNQVSAKIMDAALKVQNLMASENLTITDARSVIMSVREGTSVEDALQQVQVAEEDPPQEPEKTQLSLFDFLKSLGRVDDTEVLEAFQVAKHNSDVLSQVLLISGSLDEETIERAEKCRKLVQSNKLNREHANIAFDYAERFNVNIKQALKELHWYRPEDDVQEAEPKSDLEAVNRARAKTAATNEKNAAAAAASLKEIAKTAAQSSAAATAGGAQPSADAEVGTSTGEVPSVSAADIEAEWETVKKQVSHLTVIGKLDKALDSALKLLLLAEDRFPDRLIYCLDTVAALYTQRSNLDKAEHYYGRSLELRKTAEGDKGHMLATGYGNIGKISYFKKDWAAAEEYARKFIEVVANDKGKEHPDVACGWQNLANIFYAQKKYINAQKAYQVGIHICSKGLGDSHPTTVQMKRSCDVVLEAIAAEENAGLRDPAALGRITGSWRCLPPQSASESLHEQ